MAFMAAKAASERCGRDGAGGATGSGVTVGTTRWSGTTPSCSGYDLVSCVGKSVCLLFWRDLIPRCCPLLTSLEQPQFVYETNPGRRIIPFGRHYSRVGFFGQTSELAVKYLDQSPLGLIIVHYCVIPFVAPWARDWS